MSPHKAIFRSDAITQPRTPHIGNVKTQASTIFLVTPHLTAERRFVAPTPIVAPVTQWVVLTGIPRSEAISITVAAEA